VSKGAEEALGAVDRPRERRHAAPDATSAASASVIAAFALPGRKIELVLSATVGSV
jgi:hypothetical protein